MSECLLCQCPLASSLTIHELFSFQPYQEQYICPSCRKQFISIEKEESCPGCSRPRRPGEKKEYCIDCMKWKNLSPNRVLNHTAFFEYDESLKEWMHAYKTQGDIRLAHVFVPEIKQFYRLNRTALFVPLPISISSQYERGFNQCEEILRAARVPYRLLLENIHNGKKQSEKNRQERLESEQPFHLAHTDFPLDQRIILFDDVYTTGRTMLYAKEILLEHGCKEVASLTLAR